MTAHTHVWKETGRVDTHAGTRLAIFLRCHCGQNGYKYRDQERVIYTWSLDDPPEHVLESD